MIEKPFYPWNIENANYFTKIPKGKTPACVEVLSTTKKLNTEG